MHKILLLSVTFISFSLLSFADNGFSIKPQPSWVQSIKYDTSFHLYDDNKEDGGTYLLIDHQQNVGLEEWYRHHVVYIEEEAGIRNYSDIWIDYNPAYQQLIFHKLIIHRNGKQINRLKKKDFNVVQNETELERKIYSGNYSAGINIEDVQVGDIIEYAYTTKGENPIFKGLYSDYFSLNYDLPINKLLLRVVYPQNRKISYKLSNTDQEPEKNLVAGNVELKWEVSNVPEVILNDNLPSWYRAYATVQFSEFDSWQDVIKWSEPLYVNIDITGTALEDKLNEITADKTTEEEKINAVVEFVQDEVRYVGIEVSEHSHKPHNPAEAYRKRFGDCKDKTYLLVTLLKHLGVEACPAYVHTGLKHVIADYLPAPTVFNHVIVAISQGDTLYFIDPTISDQGGDYKSKYNGSYKKALVLHNEFGGVTDIPLNTKEKVVIDEYIEVADTLEPTTYEVITTFYGGEADRARSRI